MDEEEFQLVTIVLVAFNQEQYIKEAVESAFSQVYSPLEIILSDDCSVDSTYLIMAKMVDEYNGPHSVILKRNEKNLGIVAHFSRCVELSNGEFVVGFAGDDISLPDRVSEMYQAWTESGKTATSLFSNSVMIDENGVESDLWFASPPIYSKNIDDFISSRRCWLLGCAHAFNKSIFTKYGRIHPKIMQEDGALSFRALLEGGIIYVDKVLVKYRRHSNNVFNLGDTSKKIKLLKHEYYMKKGWQYDAERSDVKDEHLTKILKRECVKSFLIKTINSIPYISIFYHEMISDSLVNSIKKIRNIVFKLRTINK